MSCEHNDLYACQDCEMSRMAGLIADLQRQLAEAKSEIEAMRPLFVLGFDNARHPMASPYNKELAKKYLGRKQP